MPAVDDGYPASAVDQLWGAYDGFSSGNGSLQVGKFATPIFAPWLSQPLSLSGYALGAGPIGANVVGIGDTRWGASYTQMGRNGLIGNVAYLTNAGPVERAYNSNINDPETSAEGQSFVVSLQQMAIASHITGGVAFERGWVHAPVGRDRYLHAYDGPSRRIPRLPRTTSSQWR